jgi:hypothetical protein
MRQQNRRMVHDSSFIFKEEIGVEEFLDFSRQKIPDFKYSIYLILTFRIWCGRKKRLKLSAISI